MDINKQNSGTVGEAQEVVWIFPIWVIFIECQAWTINGLQAVFHLICTLYCQRDIVTIFEKLTSDADRRQEGDRL